jgi:hypothetical protein
VGFVRRIYDRWLAYALSAPAAPERHYQPKGQPAGQPAGRRPPPPTTGTAIHRPDRILRTEHRRLLDEALLARDRLWLKRIQFGWQAAIAMACEKEGIQADSLHVIPPDEWRKMALERTKAPKHIKGSTERRTWLKNAAVTECEIRGWTVTNHDAAESALLWEFGCEYVQPKATLNRLPLFQLATL